LGDIVLRDDKLERAGSLVPPHATPSIALLLLLELVRMLNFDFVAFSHHLFVCEKKIYVEKINYFGTIKR
jgi:hypothetical protein